MAAAVVSPSSSPRLPSPPPIAEDQTMPTSPGLSLYEEDGKLQSHAASIDTGALRRIRPGTKREDMAEGPPLVELHEIDSAFQLTEHLKALHYAHTHPAETNSIVPVSMSLARQLSQPPPNTAKEIWLYELARFLIQKTNAIIVHLFADEPPCSATTCPEMRASEWQYLCAVHDPPKSCSAIDYCCHTLDWAATSLTSSKMFPSRLGLGSGSAGGGSDKVLQQQMKEITNIFRRVYRIYAHAWFQHRDMFWRVEESTGLYIFFKTVCDEYGMIQSENYTIPPEAEGSPPGPDDDAQERSAPPSILRPDSESSGEGGSDVPDPVANLVTSLGDTTKRHTRVPSNVAIPVSTVIQEEVEEEDESARPEVSKDQTDAVKPPDALPKAEDVAAETAKEETGEAKESVKEDAKEDVPPAVGIARTETVKPATEVVEVPSHTQESANVTNESNDEGEVTVLMGEPETKEDEPGVEVTVAAVEPAETSGPETHVAADAKEAGKSVED